MRSASNPRAEWRIEPAPPPGYERRRAEEKLEWLWDVIEASSLRPSDYRPLARPFGRRPLRELAVVARPSRLRVSLDRTADFMPAGRPKVIHARGAVAAVRLETTPDSPFSGLLGPPPGGGAIGLLRLSLVAAVGPRDSVTPGLGLKLLVDGHPSADVLAVNHVVGQGRDFDLFSNTMTNDTTEEHRELRPPQRFMSRLFARVVDEPRRLSSGHLASRCRDGRRVDDPVAPRRLVFHPTPDARRVFDGRIGIDFRRVLGDVPVGTPLYDVEGLVGEPGTDDGRPIGRVVTTSRFVAGDGADRLFFRHVVDDLRS